MLWHVVIPVKPAAQGKSRLEVPGVPREGLARAIALDTIDAVRRAAHVAEVVVVTDDDGVHAALAPEQGSGSSGSDGETDAHSGESASGGPGAAPAALGPERGSGSAAIPAVPRGLAPETVTGSATDAADREVGAPGSASAASTAAGAPATPGTPAPGRVAPGTRAPGTPVPGTAVPGTRAPGTLGPVTRAPGTRAPVRLLREGERKGLNRAVRAGLAAIPADRARAAMLGDLPALDPADLDAALALAAVQERGLVPDAEGTGSTLVTAAGGAEFVPHFGRDSRERHTAAGFTVLDLPDVSTLRRDVDTLPQLHAAARIGLGPRTTRLFTPA